MLPAASFLFMADSIGRRRLVVNADDFGFTKDVNEGILRAHLEGIVSSVSLMANGAAFKHAVGIARRHPDLGVGCHLVLVQGRSVAHPGRTLPATLPHFVASWPTHGEMVAEFRGQIERCLDHGISLTHLDTHKHLHFFPSVLKALVQVAEEYSIGWIRKPFDVPHGVRPIPRALLCTGLRAFRLPFDLRMQEASCKTADYFAGFVVTGSVDTRWLCSLLASLPRGLGEFACHPGLCGNELLRADTRLKRSREEEMRVLCSSEVRRCVERHRIRIVSYRDPCSDAGAA